MKTRTAALPCRRNHRSVGPALGAIILALATTLALPLQAQLIHSFGSGGNAFTMDFVAVGNPGNTADGTGYGAVATGFQMGTHAVSRDMITKANSAGGLGITLADMASFGGNGVNRPATGMNWYEAAIFVNWLNTSTSKSPAYKFDSGTFVLWDPTDPGYDASNPYRNSLAVYVLPSENEWYKAAYYSSGGVYYDYPTGSDSAPTAVTGGTTAGTAVYNQDIYQGPADIANAGGLSPYGTMGQGANVNEWMESASDGINNSASEGRERRGAVWNDPAYYLESSWRAGSNPLGYYQGIGFRVAAVPEPLAGVVVAAGLGAWVVLRRRRRSL